MTKSESIKLAGVAAEAVHKRRRVERIAKYDRRPDLCRFCHSPLTYDDHVNKKVFCTKSCSASHNNLGVRHNWKEKPTRPCLLCQKPTHNVYCNAQCSADHKKLLVYRSIEAGTYTKPNKGTLRRYLFEKRDYKCEGCQLSEWGGQKIALEVHHIDGKRSNNLPSNLKLLCSNCHTLTSNWGFKNRVKTGCSSEEERTDGVGEAEISKFSIPTISPVRHTNSL